MVVMTDEGKAYSFGYGEHGNMVVKRMSVWGSWSSVCRQGLVVWTDEGMAYSFGCRHYGMLGHGGEENEFVPSRMECRSVRVTVVYYHYTGHKVW